MVGGRCILKVTPKVVWGKVLPDFVNAVFHPPCHSMVCPHVGMGKERIMKSKKGLHGPFERSLTCLTFLFLISFVLSFTVFSFTDPKRDLKGTQPWHIRQERHLWLTTTFGTSAAVDRLWLLV